MATEHARRWYSHQPNVPGRGIVASYSARFWAIAVGLGVLTGAAASALMALLHLAEHLAYGYNSGSYLVAVQSSSDARRVIALLVAAAIVAAGVAILHRLPTSGGAEVSEALWLHRGQMSLLPSFARAVLSIVTVGLGVSLGREAAPQLAGAALGSRIADWAKLPVWQRRLLVACGAGAGFAAVYNVPLGGALFALEVLLGTIALPLVLPALAVSVTATATAWITLGTAHTYHMPTYGLHPAQMVWAALVGPVIGVAAVAWVRTIERAARMRPRGRGRYIAPVIVFGLLGVVSIKYPQLLGNGQSIVQLAVLGALSVSLFVQLLVLKPIATASCLASGAPGGLFTPTLTVGVLLAGVLAAIWSHIWPHTVPASYALVGGGAFLAASMQGPLSAVVLVLELTRHFDLLMAPTLVAVTEATIDARRLGVPSIYSARLRPAPYPAGGYPDTAAVEALEGLDAVHEALPGEDEHEPPVRRRRHTSAPATEQAQPQAPAQTEHRMPDP
ncbi:MAG: chloride channel protein [Solirubrobacteraceae bacterium]